jgi:hypothetical protein
VVDLLAARVDRTAFAPLTRRPNERAILPSPSDATASLPAQ